MYRTCRQPARQQVRMSCREHRRQRYCRRRLRCQSVFTEHWSHDTHLRRHGRSAMDGHCTALYLQQKVHVLDEFPFRRRLWFRYLVVPMSNCQPWKPSVAGPTRLLCYVAGTVCLTTFLTTLSDTLFHIRVADALTVQSLLSLFKTFLFPAITSRHCVMTVLCFSSAEQVVHTRTSVTITKQLVAGKERPTRARTRDCL